MGFAEVKAPGKAHGVCGCTAYLPSKCIRPGDGRPCICTGHNTDCKGERKVWHRQLAWHEAWQGPKVSVWTTVEEALATVLDRSVTDAINRLAVQISEIGCTPDEVHGLDVKSIRRITDADTVVVSTPMAFAKLDLSIEPPHTVKGKVRATSNSAGQSHTDPENDDTETPPVVRLATLLVGLRAISR